MLTATETLFISKKLVLRFMSHERQKSMLSDSNHFSECCMLGDKRWNVTLGKKIHDGQIHDAFC
jgi:hypothetical protein